MRKPYHSEDGTYRTPQKHKRICDVAVDDSTGKPCLVFKVGKDKDGNPEFEIVTLRAFIQEVMYLFNRIKP